MNYSAIYQRYYDEYKAKNPKASEEEIDWYAKGCADDAQNGYSGAAGYGGAEFVS